MKKVNNSIQYFDGDYRYLSNFYEAPVWYDGLLYQSAEAAFQAAKNVATNKDVTYYLHTHHFDTANVSKEMKKKVQDVLTMQLRMPYTKYNPSQAKRAGRTCLLRTDWEDCKLNIMREIVRNKFTENSDLRDKLLATGNAMLIEGNTWGDTTWGMVNGVGKNHLGKILMEIREEIKENI